MGAAIAWALQRANFHLNGLVVRNPQRRQYLQTVLPAHWLQEAVTLPSLEIADCVILAVADEAIAPLADELGKMALSWQNKMVCHLSGVHSTSVLAPLTQQGAVPFSFHPILAVGFDPRQVTFSGGYVDVEGPPTGVQQGRFLAEQLHMIPIEVTPQQKIAIHLAAVVYSNFLVGIAEKIHQLFTAMDIPQELFIKPFVPLIHSTLLNLQQTSPTQALTGPITRGDVDTIAHHLQLLRQENQSDLEEVYRLISRWLVNVVAGTSLPSATTQTLRSLLDNKA